MPDIIEPGFESPQYFLTLHRPGDKPDVVREVHPTLIADGVSFDLIRLADCARSMRAQANLYNTPVTLDIRHRPSPEPNFSDGSRIQTFADGRVAVDLDENHVRIDGTPKLIPSREFDLVRVLSSRPDYLWLRDSLVGQIWGRPVSRNTLKDTVGRLRRSLGPELRQAIGTNRNLGHIGYIARRSLVK